MMKSNSVRAAWRWDSILYVVMIICVFRALDSFFMLHDTKAAIEKIFFDGKWLQRGKKNLTNPVLVMDKLGFK
jgi:hypothetical protein